MIASSGPTHPGALIVQFSGATGNGAPITRYSAVCSSLDGGQTRAAVQANGTGRVLIVAGVTRNKTYACSVTAGNLRGDGPPSTSSQVVATF